MGRGHLLLLGLLGAAVPLAAAPVRAQSAGQTRPAERAGEPEQGGRRPEEQQSDPLRAFDIDKNGRLNAAECKSAAAARFDELNPDQDDMLDPREAAPVLDAEAFRQADTNRDGQVNKAEYLAYVERLFQQADANRDENLDPAELASERGRALLHLLR